MFIKKLGSSSSTNWVARAAYGILPAVMLISACAPATQPAQTGGSAPPVAPAATSAPAAVPAATVTTMTKAADAKVAINTLLAEHVYLASVATGHALGGREPAFKATADQLDANSVALSKVVGSAYGADAETAFLAQWRAHIGMLVDYTTGVAAADKPKQDKAVADLMAYSDSFATFLSTASGMPQAATAEMLKMHIVGLKDVVDAQAAKDWTKSYAATRTAAGHMNMIGDPLAAATAKKFPDKLTGNPDSKAANLRSALNVMLYEHTYFAAMATGSALGGRDAEFKAAADQLDANSVDLSKAIGAAYGADAERAFLPLWRSHIGFFVDYTTGVATKDKAKQDKAVADLVAYSDSFASFLNSANGLPTATVSSLLKMHVTGLKDVVDAQAAMDAPKIYPTLRSAASHMSMIADPLAEATVKKFPDKFTG